MKMSNWKIICLVLFIFQINFCFSQVETKKTIVISGGTNKGAYDKTAVFIANILNKHTKDVVFSASTSTGSVENYNRLKQGLCELIITQRDIAVSQYFDPNYPFKNQEIIIPLFAECFHLLVRTDSIVKINTRDFLWLVENNKLNSISIGSNGTATNKTFRDIMAVLGWEIPESLLNTRRYEETLDQFVNNDINAFALFGMLPDELRKNSNVKYAQLNFSGNELTQLTERLTQIDRISTKTSQPNSEAYVEVNTIGTWALLVGNKGGLEEKLGIELSRKLLKSLILNLHTQDYPALMTQKFKVQKTEPPVISILDEEGMDFFRGIDINSYIYELIQGKSIVIKSSFFVSLGLIMLFILIYQFFKKYARIQKFRNKVKHYWLRLRHWVLFVSIIVFGFFIFAYILWLFELNFAQYTKLKPDIILLESKQYLTWCLIFLFTGIQEGVVVLSIYGKVLTSITSYIFLGIGFYGIGSEVKFILKKSKRMKGEAKFKSKDHYVIIGCNPKLADLVKTIHTAYDSFLKKVIPKIVIIHPNAKTYVTGNEYLKAQWDLQNIEFINVSPNKDSVLKDANILNSKAVIIIPEDESEYADEKSLFIATKLSRFSNHHSKDMEDRLYVVAQVNHPEYYQEFKKSHVNEVHCNATIMNGVLTQGLINPGIEDVMENVISFNDENELYSLDLRVYKALQKKTYDELLTMLREYDILLLGIRIVHFKGDKELIDETQKEKLNKKYSVEEKNGLGMTATLKKVRNTIINPINIAEKKYKTDDDDVVLVLAQNNNRFKELRKNNFSN